MNSSDDIAEGAPVGRDGRSATPAVRRTSNAFGSPGTDSTVKRLDLNDAFIRHPEATFIVRAAGNDMSAAGIDDGDVLLVDRALQALHGSVIIAVVAGELRCRRLDRPSGRRGRPDAVRLLAADPAVAPILITEETPLEVWGVVTTIIKSLV
jgi:DNA polymerase V